MPESPARHRAPVRRPRTARGGSSCLRRPQVVRVPSGATLRIRLFPVSAMKRFPEASTARPSGAFTAADQAGPPSPERSQAPLPATTTRVPGVGVAAGQRGLDRAQVVRQTMHAPKRAANRRSFMISPFGVPHPAGPLGPQDTNGVHPLSQAIVDGIVDETAGISWTEANL